jgi:hypothetical protein
LASNRTWQVPTNRGVETQTSTKNGQPKGVGSFMVNLAGVTHSWPAQLSQKVQLYLSVQRSTQWPTEHWRFLHLSTMPTMHVIKSIILERLQLPDCCKKKRSPSADFEAIPFRHILSADCKWKGAISLAFCAERTESTSVTVIRPWFFWSSWWTREQAWVHTI